MYALLFLDFCSLPFSLTGFVLFCLPFLHLRRATFTFWSSGPLALLVVSGSIPLSWPCATRLLRRCCHLWWAVPTPQFHPFLSALLVGNSFCRLLTVQSAATSRCHSYALLVFPVWSITSLFLADSLYQLNHASLITHIDIWLVNGSC